MWSKGGEYLKKMGGIILVASIIIWALGYFPREVDFSKDYNQLISQTEQNYQNQITESNSEIATILSLEMNNEIQKINNIKLEEKQQKSYIGQIGNFIAPVFHPMGFDWKMTVSILTGVAAKEVVVSTMGVLYQVGEGSNENNEGLRINLRNQKFTGSFRNGEHVFDNASALAFLIFILIYFPCIAVVVTITKESNWKWSAFVVTYTTALAWFISFISYQVINLL
jgi:ferrous iron transport protein B